ncbi:MAG: protein kinase [Proteobacteria bacterium]|nr:protein kinase [Pseudomonadota bacterium]
MQVEIFQAETRLDRYTVEKVLGRGGMAIVYRVRHNQLNTRHALKLLVLPTGPVRQRLLQEGRLQAKLRHPNIVSVSDVLIVDDAPGLVMEYVSGPSLREYLSSRRLTIEQVDELGRGILQAVAFAHDQGFVHRDLKPANILLANESGSVIPKVTDFGLAKIIRETDALKAAVETRTGAAMGTPAYMAPEQIRDSKSVDQRADVFSAGAVLYEMLCGDKAFSGGDTLLLFNAICDGVYRPIHEFAPKAPERMVNAIRVALETDREKRVGTVAELLALWKGEDPSLPEKDEISGPWSNEDFNALSRLGSGGDEEVITTNSNSDTWSGFFDPALDSVPTNNRTISPVVQSVLDQSLDVALPQEGVLRRPEIPSSEIPMGEQETLILPPPRKWLMPALGVSGVLATAILVLVVGPLINAVTAPSATPAGTSDEQEPPAPEIPASPEARGPESTKAPVLPAPLRPTTEATVKTRPPTSVETKAPEPVEAPEEPSPAESPPEPAIGGTLALECQPRCTIVVDGTECGSTKWSGKVAVGPRDIELKTGDATKNQRLVVYQNRTSRFCWDFESDSKCKN